MTGSSSGSFNSRPGTNIFSLSSWCFDECDAGKLGVDDRAFGGDSMRTESGTMRDSGGDAIVVIGVGVGVGEVSIKELVNEGRMMGTGGTWISGSISLNGIMAEVEGPSSRSFYACCIMLKLGDLRSESKIDSDLTGPDTMIGGEIIGGECIGSSKSRGRNVVLGFSSFIGDFFNFFNGTGEIAFGTSIASSEYVFFFVFLSDSGDNFLTVSNSNGSGSLNS